MTSSLGIQFIDNLLDLIPGSNEDFLKNVKILLGIVFLIWSAAEFIQNEESNTNIWNDPTFSIFMSFGNITLLYWLWGVSIQIWRRYHIDFLDILNIQSKLLEANYTEDTIYKNSSNLSLIYLIAFVIYSRSIRDAVEYKQTLSYAHSIPLLLILVYLYHAIYPWNKKGIWWSMLFEVIAAPFYPVNFRGSYIGDILTSLIRVFIPLCSGMIYICLVFYASLFNNYSLISSGNPLWWENTVVFRYGLVPFVTLAPLMIRFLQCLRKSIETGKNWPHHMNALKYGSAILVISFGTFQPDLRTNSVWIVSLIFTTLFQLVWDITMDWGLVVYRHPQRTYWNRKQSFFPFITLRSHRFFPTTGVYTVAAVFNAFFRFAWMLTILPTGLSGKTEDMTFLQMVSAHAGPLVASAEVVRRMVWGWLRMEYEHIELFGQPEKVSSALPSPGPKISYDSSTKSFTMVGADLEAFDKMEIGNNNENDFYTNFCLYFASPAAQTDAASSWRTWQWTEVVDVVPVPSCVSNTLEYFGLDITQTASHKARFLESVMFFLGLVLIIFIAAQSAS